MDSTNISKFRSENKKLINQLQKYIEPYHSNNYSIIPMQFGKIFIYNRSRWILSIELFIYCNKNGL